MNAVGSRHMFWNAPPSPRQLGSPLRTIPLRTGGRPLGMNGLFMGQDLPNRLNGITIPAIIGRIQISPGVQAYLNKLQEPPTQQQQYGRFQRPPPPPPPPNFPPMSDAERQILFEISKNPTAQELEDLALIDDYFTREFAQTYTTTAEVCYYASQPPGAFVQGTGRWGGGGGVFGGERAANLPDVGLIEYLVPPPPVIEQFNRYKQRQQPETEKPDLSFLNDKFYCPNPKGKWSDVPFSGWFGIDTTKPWGEVKQTVKNGQIMLQVKSSFPYPPPIDTAPNALWNVLVPLLPKIANIGKPLDPEAFKAWLTMATLENYDAVTDAIIREAKRKAKKAKRKALISAIGLTIAGIVLAFIVPAVLAAAVSAIRTVVQLYIDEKERRKAAKALADAARMFEEDAPKFAAEVQKTADMLDSEAAQEAAAQPLTPEQLAAIQEVEAETPSTPIGTYVVGGVAATGLIAALVTMLGKP